MEFLIFGTLGFWILMGVLTVSMFIWIEWEKGFFASFTVIGTILVMQFLMEINILRYVWENLGTMLMYGGLYFVAGTVWSVIKWWFFVHRHLDRYENAKLVFLREKNVDAIRGEEIPDALKAEWTANVGKYYRPMSDEYIRPDDVRPKNIRPKAYSHKSRVLMWMTYWPWSLVWTVINDPIKRLFREIYYRIANLLDNISKHVFRNVEKDFASTPPPPGSEDVAASPDEAPRPRARR